MSELFIMPILGSIPKAYITFVPTAADREWSDRNHGQSLERIKERGGFGWCELAAVFEHRAWHRMDEEKAKSVVRARASLDIDVGEGKG